MPATRQFILQIGKAALWVMILAHGILLAEADQSKAGKKSPANERGKARRLLEGWVNQGTASGLGDVYWDNRDGGHSVVKLKGLPGIQQVKYQPNEIRTRGWGLQRRVLPHTTVGNSSTAYGEMSKGSQTRMAYTNPGMHQILYQQYRGNNLYIYPEHRDHDRGNRRLAGNKDDGSAKKLKGFGDRMPTNTPYLITSQGSSGSDKPFILAVARTIGAFRPEVRKKLEETGLLMPTIQMLLRSTQRHVKSWEDYFSGRAHPAVFNSKELDEVAMLQAAHEMTPETIPPLVQLRVIEEDEMRLGTDYFAPPHRSEKLADTPAVISRIWRGVPLTRRMVVSAEGSIDPSNRPLKFKWVVLRGDPERVKITALDPRATSAEIVLWYPQRRAAYWNEDLWSNRVDIGVFASDGKAISAPAFITWYGLDNEQRSYDQEGRIEEIDYGTGRFADPRLRAAGKFRDRYHWEGKKLAGWTRYDNDGRETEFSAAGEVLSTRPPSEKEIASKEAKPSAAKRTPLPDGERLTAARAKLGNRLLQSAAALRRESQGKSPEARLVLLEAACRNAAAEGNVVDVQHDLNRLLAGFDSPFLALREEVVSLLGKGKVTSRAAAGIARMAISASRAATAAGDHEQAKRMAIEALRASRAAGDQQLIREATLNLSSLGS
jgi:hypothetical protein